MKKKICFLINKNFFQYGIANSIQKKSDFELFAIIDDNPSLRIFFENQSIINFKNILYLNDFITDQEPNLEYLKSVEKKYDLNLWQIAYTERLFYPQYNDFYHFSYEEILSFIERTCRCYEKAFDLFNPQFVLTAAITAHHELLLNKMSNSKKIPVLALEPERFSDRWYIAKGAYNQDESQNLVKKSSKIPTSNELEQYLKSHKPARFYLKEQKQKSTISKLSKSKALLKFLISDISDYDTSYIHYKKNKFTILTQGSARSFKAKRKKRESFIDKNCISQIDNSQKFIYYPLHEEPEKVILIGAPYFTEQFAVIVNIAKSLPIDYKLYVKEHPSMKNVGWRDESFYQKIMDLPNVELIHPKINQEDLIKKSSLVITIRGTVALEATIFQKPSIVFAVDYGWSSIPAIYQIKKIDELPKAIKLCLRKKISPSNIADFMEFVQKNSFDFELDRLISEVAKRFEYDKSYLRRPEIKESSMISFLQDNTETFDFVAEKFLQKINL